jgi:hypothetical protein
MSLMRQAVLFSAVGDVVGFRNGGQLRKLWGWYPEARESGSTLSKHQLGNSGNRLGRREVWFWAMQLITPRQQATPFALYYRRLRQRGMPRHAAVDHLAGELISLLTRSPILNRPFPMVVLGLLAQASALVVSIEWKVPPAALSTTSSRSATARPTGSPPT